MIITIDPRLGINIDNLPEMIFRHLSVMPNRSLDGGTIIHVENASKDAVLNELARLVARLGLLNTVRQTGDIISISLFEPNAPPAIEGAEEQGGELDNPEEEEEEEEVDEPVCGVPVNPPPQPQARAAFQILPPGPPISTPALSENGAIGMIAGCMENEIASKAKNLADKIRNYNIQWTKLLALGREIAEATVEVRGNPIIGKLINDVNELKSAPDTLIDDIFFVPNYLIVKTKELVTDGFYNDSRRVIGRMEISIRLKPLVGRTSECNDPISIRNLDRRLQDDDGNIWHCGHVPQSHSPCLGTIGQEQLFKAMELRDIHQIVEIIIRFIKNPNQSDSWGRHIVLWPEYRG